jgi:hydrogenase/urease accessory protein HupE
MRFRLFLLLLCSLCGQSLALAHDIPRTQIELQLSPTGAELTVTFAVKGFALDYPALGLDGELLGAAREAHTPAMQAAVAKRLLLRADGLALTASSPSPSTFLADRKAIRMVLHYAWKDAPKLLELETKDLFPVDPNHTVFVSLYQNKKQNLLSESVLSHAQSLFSYRLGTAQSLASVIRQFIREGIHHIFIGPDHILFIVGLLLLGGSLRQLLKIITAFTLAHSITLVLATLNILSPSPQLIEPVIALSIVFVGIQGLVHVSSEEKKRDLRLPLAFCFGLIHGFGFANVLRELALPREALGWSLFSFNIGVELGQGCIILAITPLLALLTQRQPSLARRVVVCGLWGVVLAGAYWFGQRL